MQKRTVHRLQQLNRNFYSKQATEFGNTRRHPWPGWNELVLRLGLDTLQTYLTVLDIGCGNGRLGNYLFKRLRTEVDYTGVDQSEPLLNQARSILARKGQHRLIRLNILQGDWTTSLVGETFQLVCLFGVLHHVPTRHAREQLLIQAYQLVKPSGWLAINFWQPMKAEKNRQKQIDWQRVGLTNNDVEKGDYLLRFGNGDQPRYCHHFTDTEIDELLVNVSLGELRDDYYADGKAGDSNRYVVLTQSTTQ